VATTLDLVGWDDEDAVRLRTAQQTEPRARYGDDDVRHQLTGEQIVATVVLREDDAPVACVALRDARDDLGPGTGEIKRLYTVPSARGRGHARRVVGELERHAAALGLTRLVLETGVLQPEAIGLYLSLGYRSIPSFGEYAAEPSSRCLARSLRETAARLPGRSSGRAGGGSVPVTLETVAWDDPDANGLRRAMWEFNADRYPELVTDEPDGGFASDDARQGIGVLATWLARVGGAPVGCLSLRAPRAGYPESSVELKKMYVSDAARGGGVARSLLAAAHDEARARGVRTTVLGTGIRQPEAVNLYLSSGYRPVAPYTDPSGDFLTLWFARTV